MSESAQVGTTSISSVGSGGSSPSSTSTTITVMLSRPPAALAAATSASAAAWGSDDLAQDRRDVGVGHLVDEAVAAQHEPVAADQRQGPPVDAHVGFDAEGPGDDVAARMDAGLVLTDVAGGDQFLDVAVIDRDPPQAVVAIQVRARVADVGEHERFRRHSGVTGVTLPGVGASVSPGASLSSASSPTFGAPRPASGSAMTAMAVIVVPIPRCDGLAIAARKMSVFAVAIDRTNSLAVGSAATGSADPRPAAIAREALPDPVDGDLAGDLAGLVAAHPVGDDERRVGDEEVVLVLRPHPALVGGRSDPEFSHCRRPARHCASITVVPIWRRSPGWSSFAPFSFTPLW